jgi:hypothetical protein
MTLNSKILWKTLNLLQKQILYENQMFLILPVPNLQAGLNGNV